MPTTYPWYWIASYSAVTGILALSFAVSRGVVPLDCAFFVHSLVPFTGIVAGLLVVCHVVSLRKLRPTHAALSRHSALVVGGVVVWSYLFTWIANAPATSCRTSDTSVITQLTTSNSMQPDTTNDTVQNPLIAAALVDDWEQVERLLSAGADIRMVGNQGELVPFLAFHTSAVLSEQTITALDRVRTLIQQAHLEPWRKFRPVDVQLLQKNGDWPPTMDIPL